MRYTDPTGHANWDGDDSGGICSTSLTCGLEDESPSTDITEWLVDELSDQEEWLNSNGLVCERPEFWCLDDDLSELYFTHLELFGNNGKYNIKIPMKETIGDSVIICGVNGCRWVDYSAPGNIMFGYLSAERGIIQPVAWLAGGILESKDNHFINWDYEESWYDNPGDKAAVDFGWNLHRKYPDGVTLKQFQMEVSPVLSSFQSAPLTADGYTRLYATPQTNTYEPGYFLYGGTGAK